MNAMSQQWINEAGTFYPVSGHTRLLSSPGDVGVGTLLRFIIFPRIRVFSRIMYYICTKTTLPHVIMVNQQEI